MSSRPPQQLPSHWPHRWAWLLACATFPLLWWGGFVTATGSGMAFSDWLTSDGVFMPFYPWLSSAGDKFIEHGHRLLGMLAGLLTIALAISLWLSEPRRWVRWFAAALLVGVVAQGALGGVRVKLDAHSPDGARMIALIHGCTGPLFLAACAAIVVVTSRRWAKSNVGDVADADSGSRVASAKLLRLAALTAVLAYLQLVLGAIVRHSPLMLTDGAAAAFQTAVYFHVVLALIVTAHVLWLAHKCFWRRVCRAPAVGLALLVVAQLLLGVSSWVVKYGMPQWATRLIGETGHFNRASDVTGAVIVTGHGAVGSLIVALSVVIAFRLGRQFGIVASLRRPDAAQLAGALG